MVEFGRLIMHRVPGAVAGGLLQARFNPGVYLGRKFVSSEVYVSMSNGDVVKASDYKEIPDSGAWSAEALRSIQGTPWQSIGAIPVQFRGDDESLPIIPEIQPIDGDSIATRGFILKKRHFDKIGHTDGCVKKVYRRNIKELPSVNKW